MYTPPLPLPCMMFMHVTYMHEHPGRGRWPRRDPFGNEWPPGYRKTQAGLALAGDWRAVFAGVQGDQDWFHKIFYFKRDLFAQQLINDILDINKYIYIYTYINTDRTDFLPCVCVFLQLRLLAQQEERVLPVLCGHTVSATR